MGLKAILDTSVLVPAALRDTLLRAAVRDLYELHWSAEILAELKRVLVREGMTTAEKAQYLLDTLQSEFPHATVAGGYETLIPIMENDEKDRHVLAATVRINAQAIVTQNIRHFPRHALEPFGIDAQTPDAFLVHLFHIDPGDMCESIIRQASALRRGHYTVADVLDNLGQHAPQFAALVREQIAR